MRIRGRGRGTAGWWAERVEWTGGSGSSVGAGAHHTSWRVTRRSCWRTMRHERDNGGRGGTNGRGARHANEREREGGAVGVGRVKKPVRAWASSAATWWTRIMGATHRFTKDYGGANTL